MACLNTISSCGVCASKNLEVLWDLPKLPLTEKHGSFSLHKCPGIDQRLMACTTCGHVQLANKLPPEILYTSSEYAYRTSQSSSARGGCQFFMDFVKKVGAGRHFTSFLDIGGNDFYLAKMLSPLAEQTTVIDPICSSQDGEIIDGVRVLGRFIEDVDLRTEIPQPDLVISRHVLEHISEPTALFTQLFNQCQERALYIFEIPCFDMLVEASRYDAIFHQHYHYFDIDVLKRIISATGGRYITHAHYYQGPCGGSLLVAFEKAKQHAPVSSYDPKAKLIKRRASISHYQAMMKSLSHQLQNQQVYGYGASLMLATLAYHLNSDLSELICLLDDDPAKEGWEYQNVPVKVRWTGAMSVPENSNFLITSLENVRPIFRKLITMNPRRILVPGTI